MKVVLNRSSSAAFRLSNKAVLWLHNAGANIAVPIEKMFPNPKLRVPFTQEESLENWKANKNEKHAPCGTIFSDDDKFVLDASGLARNDPLLVACVEMLGEDASSVGAQLEVFDIPDGVACSIRIDERGAEFVLENHNVWPEGKEPWRYQIILTTK